MENERPIAGREIGRLSNCMRRDLDALEAKLTAGIEPGDLEALFARPAGCGTTWSEGRLRLSRN